MDARIRIKSEFQAIAGAWVGIMFLSLTQFVLPAFLPQDAAKFIGGIAFWFGVPFLAVIPYGVELHCGTLSSLLTQPIARATIWNQKMLVASVAVALAGIPYFIFWWGEEWWLIAAAGVWALLSVCSAPFWALQTKSAIGGLAGNLLHIAVITPLGIAIGQGVERWVYPRAGFDVAITVGLLLAAVYAPFMLWLGRRKLLNLQLAGSTSAADSVGPPEFLQQILPGFLRCRQAGFVFNLIRKDACLLWPLWPLASMILIVVVAVRLTASVTDIASSSWLSVWPQFLLVVVFLYGGMVALLSGCLPVGLERESGTHSMQLTLPVSTRALWAIKLSTSVGGTLLFAVPVWLLTMLLLGPAFLPAGGAFGEVSLFYLILWPLATVGLFWCAAASKGPMQAVLLAGPVAGAILGSYLVGGWLGAEALSQAPFLDTVTGMIHPFPVDWQTMDWLRDLLKNGYVTALLLGPPLLILAIVQSYRLFRQDVSDSVIPLLRRVAVLGGVAAIVGVIHDAPLVFAQGIDKATDAVLRETADAVRAKKPDLNELEKKRVDQISLGDLSSLSWGAKRWLRDGSITLTAGRARSRNELVSVPGGRLPPVGLVNYFITIRLAGGTVCVFYDNPDHRHSCTVKAPTSKEAR